MGSSIRIWVILHKKLFWYTINGEQTCSKGLQIRETSIKLRIWNKFKFIETALLT